MPEVRLELLRGERLRAGTLHDRRRPCVLAGPLRRDQEHPIRASLLHDVGALDVAAQLHVGRLSHTPMVSPAQALSTEAPA